MISYIGIAIDAPKYSKGNSEDFILLDCGNWSAEQKKYYKQKNERFNFFNTTKLTSKKMNVKQFSAKELHFIKQYGRIIAKDNIFFTPCSL